jgi:hypothetical protein
MQQQRSPKISLREIFRVVRFSTFATISATSLHFRASIHPLCFREFPPAVEDVLARLIEPDHVIPPFRGRQAVRDFAVAAAELNGDAAVVILLRGDAVQRVGVEVVLLQVTVCGVDDDGPKSVDRYIVGDSKLVGVTLR